jgi:hypothetical protein
MVSILQLQCFVRSARTSDGLVNGICIECSKSAMQYYMHGGNTGCRAVFPKSMAVPSGVLIEGTAGKDRCHFSGDGR